MNYSKIKSIKKIACKTSYELEIEDTHCFFVNGMLKHNCRCVAIVNVDKNGNASTPIFKSRQNKEFTTLSNLVEPVKKLAQGLPEGQYMFDGECCILDENGDEHFDWVMKEITRKNHTILNPCYNIFDFLPAEVFYGKEESLSFSERLDQIHILMEKYIEDGGDKDRIHILHQEKLMNQSDFDRWSQYVKEGNWEGFMLRKDTTYKGGRSKDLIKVKLFQDAEYTVVGTTNGTATYNEGGQKEIPVCSSLIIEHKGNQVFVGTGLSKEQRILWLDHPEEIVGKTITVQYFEETKDSKTGEYSLRFPVLKCVYDNGRNI